MMATLLQKPWTKASSCPCPAGLTGPGTARGVLSAQPGPPQLFLLTLEFSPQGIASEAQSSLSDPSLLTTGLSTNPLGCALMPLSSRN